MGYDTCLRCDAGVAVTAARRERGLRSRRIASQIEETATVVALTHDGEGIVRQGKAAFVPGALPGESIRFRRTRQHRQHDEAQLLEVLQPSDARVTPQCAHFGVCGGCA